MSDKLSSFLLPEFLDGKMGFDMYSSTESIQAVADQLINYIIESGEFTEDDRAIVTEQVIRLISYYSSQL